MAAAAGSVGLPGLPCPRVLHKQRRTPDHPPYSEMIQAAIRALENAGGSTASAIDRHIRSAYQDLPWGHHNLLPYYLRKLTAAGEIARTRSGLYCLDDDDPFCADAAAPPPPWPSEVQNGTLSRPNSPAQPHQLGGDDDRLENGDLADEDAPLAMLLPHHQKGALPRLSIRRLKQKLRERNSSFSPSIEDPVAAGYSVLRRRRRPPKPKATVVISDDRKEAAPGHEGCESEAKLVGTSSTADPTDSPVLRLKGRTPKRKDAIILKDDQLEAGSRDESWQPAEPKLWSASSNRDPASFPVIRRRGRPPKRRSAVIPHVQQREVAARSRNRQSDPLLISSTSSIDGPIGPHVIKRRGRPPKRRSAVIPHVQQREVAARSRNRQSDPLLISSTSSIDGPICPHVIKRRGRPPKPKAAMTLPDDQPEAAAVRNDRQSELKLATVSSTGDPTSSAVSAPVKRRGRPPKPKAEPCHEPEPEAELPKQNAVTQSYKEETKSVIPGHGGTREETGLDGSDAIAASEGERRASTRCGLAGAGGDVGRGIVTRSASANGWPRPEATAVGEVGGNWVGPVGGSTEGPTQEQRSRSEPKRRGRPPLPRSIAI